MKKNKSDISKYGDIENVKLGSEKIKRRDQKIRTLKLGLLISSIALTIIYFLLRAKYADGRFTVSIDEDFSRKTGIVAYENLDEKDYKIVLKADILELADNISGEWIPKDINELGEGSHNGDNYLAYTFYLHNMGQDEIDYWYSIPIDEVLKNADNAIRVKLFINDEATVYAKKSAKGTPEPGTEAFYKDNLVMIKERENFKPGEIDKITVVIWIEGDDPECLNDIIGGEVKMHMDITSENKPQKEEEKVKERKEKNTKDNQEKNN